MDRCKSRILQTMLDAPQPAFIAHADDPEDEGIPGDWKRVADSTWSVAGWLDLDHPDVRHWLHGLGNWLVYAAPQPVTPPWPDPTKTGDGELLDWMSESGVSVLIDSFHDDVSWVVALIPRALDQPRS